MVLVSLRLMVGREKARFCFVLGALFGGFFLAGQGGNDLEAGVETIENLNWSAFTALRSAQTISGTRTKSASLMAPVRAAILKDGSIDAAEHGLLEKLSESTGGPQVLVVTSVSPSGTAVSEQFVNGLPEGADRPPATVYSWIANAEPREEATVESIPTDSTEW